MLTLEGARHEVEKQTKEVEQAERAVEEARAAIATITREGDGTARERILQIADAKNRATLAVLAAKRARDALAAAQAAVAHVAAHEEEFNVLASLAAQIARQEAKLNALGVETRQRVEAELAELRALVAQAQKVQAGLPGTIVAELQLQPAATLARRWVALSPGVDALAVLAAAAAVEGAR